MLTKNKPDFAFQNSTDSKQTQTQRGRQMRLLLNLMPHVAATTPPNHYDDKAPIVACRTYINILYRYAYRYIDIYDSKDAGKVQRQDNNQVHTHN